MGIPACQYRRCTFDPWVGKIPGLGRSLEKEMATHSRILAWEISWIEEPGGLSPWGHKRVGYNLTTNQQQYGYAAFYLSIHQLMNIWIVPTFWLL